jgi:hypothetical protein
MGTARAMEAGRVSRVGLGRGKPRGAMDFGVAHAGRAPLTSPAAMERIAFTKELIEWYWQHGCKRADDYAIPTSTWLRKLYEVEKQLDAVGEARAHARPAMAIWGPSQTGKSTLVSAFIDVHAAYERKEGVDGTGSALHWPGGSPMFFMAPELSPPAYLNKYVLNPFNQGWDGSSALSRFVYGTTDPKQAENGLHFVRDVRHPVSVHLISAKDLLQVVARGYDTECLGPSKTRDATMWTIAEFEARLVKFKRRQTATPRGVSRAAFEALFDLCDVINDLVVAELPRYKKLLEEGEGNWHSMLASLLADPVLLASPEVVDDFAADVLWDDYAVLTRLHRRTREELERCQKEWAGRPVFASLESAAVFLNMEACRIYFEPQQPAADTQEGIVYDSIARLGWREENGAVLIGCGPGYPQRLADAAERFGCVQGLVWELVIPLNPANLAESPFRAFLHEADLLDFAGVGNEPKSDVSRIDLEPAARDEGPQKGKPFEPVLFFKQILKRGKTACIVSTYAKRLTIDGFNIFQNIDKFAPVNAPQLINGVNTWWKYFVPEFYKNPQGPSPLPLNLGLMWWAPRLAESVGTPERIFKAIVPIYSELGPIADPSISRTFAFNYYKFPRGKVDFEFVVGGKVYEGICASPEFQKQFNNPVSRQSFDEMVSDRVTGGTSYFFTALKQQLDAARASPTTNRLALVEAKVKTLETDLADLLKTPRLFPPAKVVDVRREMLERFRTGLLDSLKGKPEKQVSEINYALREFLDVPYQVLHPPPADDAEIDRQFILRQYRQWADHQLARYDQWERSGRHARPDWSLLGLPTREAFRECLDALRASVEGSADELARWLARLAQQTQTANSDLRNTQMRRHLAVRMANELVSSRTGDLDFSSEETETPTEEEAVSPPIGRECLTYRAFIRPFIEGQLAAFLSLRIDPTKRPDDLPGDKELAVLCERHRLRPA